MSELTVTKENFETEVLHADESVLLDFWADWCGPCRMLSPVISEIAEEHPEIRVGRVNVDEQPELASAFGVSGIPTVVVMKNGKVANMSVGVRPKAQIVGML